ncbi:hypothetical protein G6F33_012155 [Rhizopus arrhizus]|uniref:Uncharacterized protein n=1 Tax=Rhizopus oryzae TaxID=64495 RepID=A0A9P6WZ30_RHIOR|nr:hypothetical protein G6F23_009995 [Rhizopus arrhizus]KAG0755289.1 hypothetical protein G6F24_011931 [Rhizopus arrhizus]KAG0905454.1 hypothetical protein G6F33_012155 [Rhizopus arrhizus]KAG0930961.1 hypothetical protein G6F32_011838 [Rhizopus arrhizus]KAG1103313.1 hypothetical protein G6F42_017237 [Rhizopus arrhizus]
MDINATSVIGLHVFVFIKLFGLCYFKPSKTKQFNTVIWNEIYSSFIHREKAINAYHDALTIAATPAASKVCQLTSPTNNNAPNNSISPNGNDDESTQSDDDIHCDNSTITPILVYSVRSSLLASSSGKAPSSNEPLPSTPLPLALHASSRDRFFVDRIDISERFYSMQQYVFDFLRSNNLTLESDVHLILSLSSILLLKNNNQLYKDMVPFFAYKFLREILLKTIEVAQSVYNKTSDRINAATSLLSLANTMDDPMDKKLIVSASQLLQFLPMDPTNLDICDTTLVTRYILHAIQSLFDDHERDIRLKFAFTESSDNHNPEVSFTGYPECIITVFPYQTDDGVNVGYDEAKRQSMTGNHYLVNWDLVRPATFGKNTIDENKLSGNLSIHMVGPFITFYLIKLHADGLYCMTGNADIFSWRRDSLLATDVMLILDKKKKKE